MRNVVLVCVDTLRADRLDPYGSTRGTSPNLAGLAKRSVVFDNALAQASQTAPSHGSLFTSQYAGTHGLVNVNGGQEFVHKLPPDLPTLAGLLTRKGLQTIAFVSDGNLTKKLDLNRGFAQWDEKNEDVRQRVDAACAWLDAHPKEPFFLFFHTYQVHAPYVPPAEYAKRFTDPKYDGPLRARLERYQKMTTEEAWAGGVGADYWEGMLDYTDRDVKFLSDLYDGEIAYADHVLRDLFERLLTGPLAANTALIMLADHGEEFRDHGKFQHDQAFQELLHVPLIMHVPGELEREGWKGRIAEPVELIDVAPTIADLLGIDWHGEGWQGESLIGALDPARRAGALHPDRTCFAELTLEVGPKTYETVIKSGWKYIYCHQKDIDKTWEQFFDLNTDPHEAKNLIDSPAGEAAGKLAELKSQLAERRRKNAEIARTAGQGATGTMDPEWDAQLKQLGYTGSGGHKGK